MVPVEKPLALLSAVLVIVNIAMRLPLFLRSFAESRLRQRSYDASPRARAARIQAASAFWRSVTAQRSRSFGSHLIDESAFAQNPVDLHHEQPTC